MLPSSPRSKRDVFELGDVLYGAGSTDLEREADWAALVHATAQGDLRALHALYDRAHRTVYTLAMRITGDRQAAEQVTLGVFLDVRRQASSFDPEKTTVLAWIMALAHARAIDGSKSK
jgi:RNA polymerase sigma-70 factor (ECF subfamily)